jgi:peptide/nickel transport system substrate-binding protein
MGRQPRVRWASLKIAAMLYAGVTAVTLLPSAAAADDALVIARDIDINSLDPARGFCDTCQIYFSNVYETLVGLGKDNATLTPRLAASWEANADQSQFTFHLDPDAKFSDSSPVRLRT